MTLCSIRELLFMMSTRRAIALWRVMGAIACLMALSGCRSMAELPTRTIAIQQNWQLQPGATVAGLQVQGGLGDISIELAGGKVYAPFAGQVQPGTHQCLLFSSPEVPAYLLRFCGLSHLTSGSVQQGDAIAWGNTLQVAALRKQPDGQWAMVEPSVNILERSLNP